MIRVTSPKHEELFDQLIMLAHRDIDLVMRAISVAAGENDLARLDDIVPYILAHRAALSRASAAGETEGK